MIFTEIQVRTIFFRFVRQQLNDVVLALHRRGCNHVIDVNSVANKLKAALEYNIISGKYHIRKCFDMCRTSANVQFCENKN